MERIRAEGAAKSIGVDIRKRRLVNVTTCPPKLILKNLCSARVFSNLAIPGVFVTSKSLNCAGEVTNAKAALCHHRDLCCLVDRVAHPCAAKQLRGRGAGADDRHRRAEARQ